MQETKNSDNSTIVLEAKPDVHVAKFVPAKVGATHGVSDSDNRGGQGRGEKFGGKRNERKGSRREDRVRSEFDQKLLAIRRVTRVAAGGRRFNFSVALVLGNRKGSVGVGIGKASDTALAIDKAIKNAKKHLVRLFLTKTSSIPYKVSTKYSSAKVLIMPAPGRGLVAGSALRDVIELGGVKDVVGKIISGSKNKLNIARASVKALSEFQKITNNQETNIKQETKIN